MGLTLRKNLNRKLTIQEMDDNFTYLESISIGVQGPQGAQGLPGGVQGFQGTIGTTGSIGFQGLAGLQGVIGFQGVLGFQGVQGPQGFQGNQGWQGLQGNQGWQGPIGFQGNQGWQGLQGATGSQGNQGWQGFQGWQGLQGFQGNQGNQGWQGLVGVTGSQGPININASLNDITTQGNTSSNSILIGTVSSNGSKLLVAGSASFTGRVKGATAAAIDEFVTWSQLMGASSSYFNQGLNSFGTTASLGTFDAFPLSIKTGNTQSIFITTQGRLIVGTTSQNYLGTGSILEIFGSASFTGRVKGATAQSNDEFITYGQFTTVNPLFFVNGVTASGMTISLTNIIQTYTTGTAVTINNGITGFYVNPSTMSSILTITMPSAPYDGQELKVSFGGTIKTDKVVNVLYILANTNQYILTNTPITTASSGDGYIFKWDNSSLVWRVF